ncbi:hypothetical protein JCM19046_3199 [Bacillus sp. JCM 19046]|nr:hypothetical protein JCM19045_1400 [Bacillus sp. JCM 19045]GAF18614.1 hypothetical protein JCM19046_3199 [Bacillus sp. JCM 19046]
MNEINTNQNRIVSLDVMRGVALLGILIANSIVFQFGMLGSVQPVTGMYQNGQLDETTHFLIRFLVDGSFITLFSFLFGYGMSLQKQRLAERLTSYSPVFWRRTTLLLLFGLIHLLFIWRGDILVTYALTAMLLFAFLFLSTRGIGISALIWFAAIALMVLLPDMGEVTPPAFYTVEQAIISEGSYSDHVLLRSTYDLIGISAGNGALFVFGEIFFQLSAVITVMPMFLIGAYVARKKWLEEITQHKRLFFISIPLFLIVGLIAKFPNAYVEGTNSQLELLSYSIGAPALALFYAGCIALLVHYLGNQLFAPFAAVGKMAFTNYLFQSIVFTFLFAGYGFGLFAELGLFYGTLIAIGFYLIQVLASTVWLRFFLMGPLEWIWRAGTYLKAPKLKR